MKIPLLVLLIIGVSGCTAAGPMPTSEVVHEHAGFKVYLDGQQFNFSQQKYMDIEDEVRGEHVDMHDLNGEVIHKHSKGATLGIFFESLKMGFNSTCFVTDAQESYCSSRDKKLRLYVNGVEKMDYGNYLVMDLDRILVTYGDQRQEEVQKQINSVSDTACIYSEKCPERGSAPDETSCTGQTVCKV